jgi:hypothetical protein
MVPYNEGGEMSEKQEVDWSFVGQKFEDAEARLYDAVRELQRGRIRNANLTVFTTVFRRMDKARLSLEKYAGTRWGELWPEKKS